MMNHLRKGFHEVRAILTDTTTKLSVSLAHRLERLGYHPPVGVGTHHYGQIRNRATACLWVYVLCCGIGAPVGGTEPVW